VSAETAPVTHQDQGKKIIFLFDAPFAYLLSEPEKLRFHTASMIQMTSLVVLKPPFF
jgi:hypothetical protein